MALEVLTLLNDQIPASSSICAAFVRLKVSSRQLSEYTPKQLLHRGS